MGIEAIGGEESKATPAGTTRIPIGTPADRAPPAADVSMFSRDGHD